MNDILSDLKIRIEEIRHEAKCLRRVAEDANLKASTLDSQAYGLESILDNNKSKEGVK